MEPLSTRTLAGAVDVKFLKGLGARALPSGHPHEKRHCKRRLPVPRLQSSRRKAGSTGFGSGVQGCYKASVNESETINEAKAL